MLFGLAASRIAKQKGFSEIYKQLEMSAPFTNPYWHDLSPIEATLLEQDELLLSAAREEAAYAISKAVLEQWDIVTAVMMKKRRSKFSISLILIITIVIWKKFRRKLLSLN